MTAIDGGTSTVLPSSLVVTVKPFLQSGTNAQNDHSLANLNFVADTAITVIFSNFPEANVPGSITNLERPQFYDAQPIHF